MHYKYWIACSFGLMQFITYGQETIEEWQSNHPNVLFIEQSDYNQLSEKSLASLKTDYIVFDTEITMEVIRLYQDQNTITQVELTPEKFNEGNRIKAWIGEHQDVKIITNSYYSQLSTKEKTLFEGPNFILLAGDLITLEDIEHYENIH
ncbi:MAG: hypothetical protein ACJA1C_001538 [Crocinitomicaceae bacterium]|jgi:hypothetical protein